MSMLNIKCSICSEFYNTSDRIYSTLCGHLFHYQCLHRWLANFDSCPQCRRCCQRHRVHRVFLDYEERTNFDNEIENAFSNINTPIWVPFDEPMAFTGAPETPPTGAIISGKDTDNNDVYVARVPHEDDLLPANYVPQKGGAYIPWGCRAHFLRRGIELLVDCKCKWVADSNGAVPADAIVTGYTEAGENLYTGRAIYNGILLPGKVHPSHSVLYMPYNGIEVNTSEYEVLVLDTDTNPADEATMAAGAVTATNLAEAPTHINNAAAEPLSAPSNLAS